MLYNAKQWHFPASPEQYKSGYPSGYYSLGKGVKARLVGTTMRADRWTAPSRQLLGTTHGMAARQPSVRRGVAAFGSSVQHPKYQPEAAEVQKATQKVQ